jgi:hypothetical protein
MYEKFHYDTFSLTPLQSDGLLSSEFSIAGGSTVMLDGRTGAIFIRVLGSGYSPPLELVASDKVTVIQARTRGATGMFVMELYHLSCAEFPF